VGMSGSKLTSIPFVVRDVDLVGDDNDTSGLSSGELR